MVNDKGEKMRLINLQDISKFYDEKGYPLLSDNVDSVLLELNIELIHLFNEYNWMRKQPVKVGVVEQLIWGDWVVSGARINKRYGNLDSYQNRWFMDVFYLFFELNGVSDFRSRKTSIGDLSQGELDHPVFYYPELVSSDFESDDVEIKTVEVNGEIIELEESGIDVFSILKDGGLFNV